MAENPRKNAFKAAVMEIMREAGPRTVVTKAELIAQSRTRIPDHVFDDTEPCHPKCKSHRSKWQHEFDRSIYDLTASIPRKIRSADGKGYVLGP